jgi:hypothetical protein
LEYLILFFIAVAAGLTVMMLRPWLMRRYFPDRAEIEFRHWSLYYNRAPQMLSVQAQAIITLDGGRVHAQCDVEIGGAVHLTTLETPVGRHLFYPRILVFKFARQGSGVQFDPEAPPKWGE